MVGRSPACLREAGASLRRSQAKVRSQALGASAACREEASWPKAAILNALLHGFERIEAGGQGFDLRGFVVVRGTQIVIGGLERGQFGIDMVGEMVLDRGDVGSEGVHSFLRSCTAPIRIGTNLV